MAESPLHRRAMPPRRQHPHSSRSASPRSSRARWSEQYAIFRRRLVVARHDAQLSQADAAKALGRIQSYVAKCETGERRVDIVELAQFAALYRKPITYFMP